MCRVVASLFMLSVGLVGFADELPHRESTDRILRASGRIFSGNARGSGVIFDADADNYRVLTNAHVVGRRGNRVDLEFEHSGYRSGRIAGPRDVCRRPATLCSFAYRPRALRLTWRLSNFRDRRFPVRCPSCRLQRE